MKKNIIFDLDGVLLSSLKLMELSWIFCQNKFNISQNFDEYSSHIGKPFEQIMFDMGIKKNIAKDVELAYHLEAMKYIGDVKLYEGVYDLLVELKNKNYLLSIVTSKNRERTLKIVKSLRIENIFDCIITPEDLPNKRGKPEPDGLILAIKKTDSLLSESVYIGDMDVDRIAAERCHCDFIFAKWGYGSVKTDCIEASSVSNLREKLLKEY